MLEQQSETLFSIVNLFVFILFIFISIFLLYIGKNINSKKKITLPWINLSIGIFLIALEHIINPINFPNTPIINLLLINLYLVDFTEILLIVIGSIITIISFILIYKENSNQILNLNERHEELHNITKKLKQKFMSREIPEEELKKINIGIVKELTEIEVKLDKLKKPNNLISKKINL